MATSHYPEQTPLVERLRELSLLTDSFERGVKEGEAVSVLVDGPVGTGKTRLLDAFAEWASKTRNAFLLRATCARSEEHLSLGVVRQLLDQLLDGPDAPGVRVSPTVQRLREDVLSLLLSSPDPDAARQAAFRAQIELVPVFQDLARERPVVVFVDDAHHMDPSSAHCLLYAIRRLRSPVVFVLAQPGVPSGDLRSFYDELLHQGNCRSLRLRTLSVAGVRQVVDAVVDAFPQLDAEQFAGACHEVTGGNPRLMHAMLSDLRPLAHAPRAGVPESQAVGEFFARAVSNCLLRAPVPIQKVARAMAVLGHVGSPVLVARLCGVEPIQAEKATAGLTTMGLVVDGGFRSGPARLAVLEEMSPEERAELHGRTAELLHENGGSAMTLARHLIVGGKVRGPWAIGVLHEAARQAAVHHDVGFAVACLELATLAGSDERRPVTKAMLLDVAWRRDPAVAGRHVNGLVEALHRGEVEAEQAVTLVWHLLWQGRIGDAAAALDRLRDSLFAEDGRELPVATALRAWLAHSFPMLLSLFRPGPTAAASSRERPGRETVLYDIDHRVRAQVGLAEVLGNRTGPHPLADARQVLRGSPGDELTYTSVHAALLTLVYADRTGEARQWCERLLAGTSRHEAPTWHAQLTSVLAEVRLRSGAVVKAEESAAAAMAALPERSWGVAIGQPLVPLLQAQVLLGKLEQAGQLVERPLSPAMLQSRHGLTYRYAVGQYQLARQSPQAALDLFLEAGELARVWGLDSPSLVPWRGGAAEALVALGRPGRAGELLAEQLELAGDEYPRARAMTLRSMAALVDLEKRGPLLSHAVELLRACGDRVELARTLLALGTMHGALGEARRARIQTQLAYRVAKECGVPALLSAQTRTAPPEPTPVASGLLTFAEQRVATLAARGHTNREIATQLFITPSTVEQHLTRVFRKLKVKQREELPLGLGLHSFDAV